MKTMKQIVATAIVIATTGMPDAGNSEAGGTVNGLVLKRHVIPASASSPMASPPPPPPGGNENASAPDTHSWTSDNAAPPMKRGQLKKVWRKSAHWLWHTFWHHTVWSSRVYTTHQDIYQPSLTDKLKKRIARQLLNSRAQRDFTLTLDRLQYSAGSDDDRHDKYILLEEIGGGPNTGLWGIRRNGARITVRGFLRRTDAMTTDSPPGYLELEADNEQDAHDWEVALRSNKAFADAQITSIEGFCHEDYATLLLGKPRVEREQYFRWPEWAQALLGKPFFFQDLWANQQALAGLSSWDNYGAESA